MPSITIKVAFFTYKIHFIKKKEFIIYDQIIINDVVKSTLGI